uniref:Uncharacterized protein n=1 Tax=Plectus sambesii TaxID=2011161 RepID=A0A914XMH3_9BILA
MFYGLPVVQLVLIWQNTVNMSGDMDICFFNFRCARSFFSIYAFNSVISNIGYIALGVLFIIMVKQREVLHRRTVGSVMQDEEAEFGLPMHNGLLYALGIAIIMEGILSGSYHICPSPSNYQFDTSFMYILGVLGMLKLYQLRHSDINPNAHVSYAIMAFFIFMAMCGVYFDSLIFYIIFAVCYLIIMTLINVEFYFNTQWTLDFGMFGRMREAYSGIFKECPKGIMPTYKGRFLFLAIADAINILFVISGIITLPKNFASFLLMPFVGNLTLYLAYYLFMKKLHHEHIRLRTIAFILLASASWGASLYFFMNNVSDWIETPANSRTLNRECVLFHFYDNHDIWHFLSAMSLFFSFNIFLSLDDDLKWVRRNKIAVF